MTTHSKSTQLFIDWQTNPRWKCIKRPYTAEEVLRLRSKVEIEYTLARMGAEKLWKKLNAQSYVAALGALTGNQAGFSYTLASGPNCSDTYSADPSVSGVTITFTVTAHNVATRTITGTFSGTAKNLALQVISISSGSFKGTY